MTARTVPHSDGLSRIRLTTWETHSARQDCVLGGLRRSKTLELTLPPVLGRVSVSSFP